MTSQRVAVIGSINVDILLRVDEHPRPGQTILGSGGVLSPGGKGANQALAAARQGARTIMVGAIGADANADTAIELLREADVDLRHVGIVQGPTGLAAVVVDQAGENSIIVIPGANNFVDDGYIESALVDVLESSVVVVQGEIPTATVDSVAKVVTGTSIKFLLNLAPVIAVAPSTLRRADPLIVNEHEAEEALGLLVEIQPASLDDPVVIGRFLARALVEAGVPSAVVTLGPFGAVVADTAGVEYLPAPKVSAIDTTGAGDAFVGTVAAGLAHGLGLREACRNGIDVAASSVQSPGAQASYPWADSSGVPQV